VFRAVAWTPAELSFTPLPVDPGATVRSQGDPMTAQTQAAPADSSAQVPASPAVSSDPVTNRASVNASIRSIADVAGLDRGWADAQIDAGVTVEAARAAAFDTMATRRQAPVNNRAPVVQMGQSYDDPEVRRRAMTDALAANLCPKLIKAEGQAIQYRSYRPLDMAAELLTLRGETINRFDREGLLVRALGAHSSSDFPLLLADAANKSLLAQYAAAAPTYRQWAARKSFTDFKSHKFLRIGDFPTFREVTETGEVKYGTISENQETVTAKEFATGIVIGRKALLNDDLSALSDFSSLIATRASSFENTTVYALLASDGPTLAEDNKALFHADHGNKAGSGTTLANGIDAAVLALRSMTGLDGLALSIQPRFLIVGPAQEANARRLLTAITPAKSSDVNPWAGAFELIVDPNITGNRWLLAADPVQVPSVVFGYVNGAEGPQIFTETDFDTRAVKVRAGLDFGAGVIDFRGLYSNAGA
jgi:phage major head subunit gpT-like protein